MKLSGKILLVVLILALLAGCGNRVPEEAAPTEGKYLELTDLLEKGDYDGARALIDAMEGEKEENRPPETQDETEAAEAAVQTEGTENTAEKGKRVELTKENVKEYFEISENFFSGPKPGFEVGLTLKGEYVGKLEAVEGAAVKVSYLYANAYGTVDSSGEFQLESYEIAGEANPAWVDISGGGIGSLANGSYSEKKGYFPDYPVDVTLTDGRGVLIFAD